jgi:C4-dicarboxylate transporter DctM subunit
VAWIGMELFSSRPAGDAMAVTIWGSSSSWTLTALPLFVWMGEILFRTGCPGHVQGPGALDAGAARAPAAHQRGRLHHLRRRVGLQRRHLRHHRQDDPARAEERGYPDDIIIGTLAGAGTLGLLIPPSIIMIVYGVTAEVSIASCSSPACCRACCWRCCSRATSWSGRC